MLDQKCFDSDAMGTKFNNTRILSQQTRLRFPLSHSAAFVLLTSVAFAACSSSNERDASNNDAPLLANNPLQPITPPANDMNDMNDPQAEVDTTGNEVAQVPNGENTSATTVVDSNGDDSVSLDYIDIGVGLDFKFDIGAPLVGANVSNSGCQKVDFLFVIDNSDSMADDQQRLITAFPGFIDAIENTIDAKNFHIGVISTDDHFQGWYYNGGHEHPEESCANYGGLVRQNVRTTTNSIEDCGPWDSNRNYLSNRDDDLKEEFECAAWIDDKGSTNEAPFLALDAALNEPPSPCNDGFLRDDALLVIMLITDEDDDNDGNPGSGGDPDSWYEEVIAAKDDDPTKISVLGLVGDNDTCTYDPTPRIREFISKFGANGHTGGVCLDDYAGFFEESVTVVDRACSNFPVK